MSKKKIYIFNNGGPEGWMRAVAICEDGVIVTGHISSHEGFMQHDMGLTSDWKHDKYNEHCGEDNWELEWVDTDDVVNSRHEGLEAALIKHQELAQAGEKTQSDSPPGISVTVQDGKGEERTVQTR